MNRTLNSYTGLLILTAASFCRAQVPTDDFSTGANWTAPRSLTSPGTIQFSSGVANYVVSNPSRNNHAFTTYIPGVMPYNRDWSVQIDISFAKPSDIFTGNVEQALSFNLGVIRTGAPIAFDPATFIPQANTFETMANLFSSDRNVYARGFDSQYSIAGDDFYDDGFDAAMTNVPTVVSLRISFNNTTKVLSASYDLDGPSGSAGFTPLPLTVDVDSARTNWSMNDSDTFTVYIAGNSLFDAETGTGTGPVVAAGRVTADNFRATGITSVAGSPGTGRLSNLSILTSLASASDSFTMGYVAGGAGTTGTKPLVVRAVGPSLSPLGVSGVLVDPKLELFAGSTPSGENDNWGGGTELTNAMAAVGAFAFINTSSRDSAVLANVPSSVNASVKVSGTGTGTVLAEIYDATPSASMTGTTPRLINVSVLKDIGPGITAGFVVGGSTLRTVLIRAVGPTLGSAPFNVPSVVADPQLALFQGSKKIAENNNWGGTPMLSAAFTDVGAFALSIASKDAAILATLAPGNYSVQVSGVGGTTGTALIEIYEAP